MDPIPIINQITEKISPGRWPSYTDAHVLMAVQIIGSKKGIGRQEGHEIMRNSAIEARNKDVSMKEIMMKNNLIKEKFKESELDEMLDPRNYIGKAVEQVDALVKKLKAKYL